MGIKIDSEKIDSSLGVIRSFANDNVVDMIDQLSLLLIVGSKLLSFLHSLVDVLLGHIGGSGDGCLLYTSSA